MITKLLKLLLNNKTIIKTIFISMIQQMCTVHFALGHTSIIPPTPCFSHFFKWYLVGVILPSSEMSTCMYGYMYTDLYLHIYRHIKHILIRLTP
jgi:hypothetical protein